MPRFLGYGVCGFVALTLLLLVGEFLGVSICYRVPITNQPLSAPVPVICVTSNRILLSDGRVIEFEFVRHADWLQEVMREGGNEVELRITEETVWVSAKQRIFYCGTGRRKTLVPLIPLHYLVYRRAHVAEGILVN
jgi:hypothetical protein